jgi:hypothetical protein
MAKTNSFLKVVRASSHTLKTANIESCYDPLTDSGIMRPIIGLS